MSTKSNHRIYGLDFGASNTTISTLVDDKAIALPIDNTTPDSTAIPTLLFYLKGIYCGSEAYMRLKNQSEKEQGRFIREIKSAAAVTKQDGTIILGKYRSFSDIIGDYLKFVKKGADRIIGENIDSVVIGRPVFFSKEPQGDATARERIREGARKAGFKDIFFAYEPVAASIDAAENLNPGEKILTFDFGGSTLDLHLLEIIKQQDKKIMKTLDTSGIQLGGNDISKKIFREKILKYFGKDLKYVDIKSFKTPKPTKVVPYGVNSALIEYDVNRSPKFYNNIYKMIDLMQWEAGKTIPELEALRTCLKRNYYFDLFDAVDKAKIELSSKKQTEIVFQKPEISITEKITRSEFDKILAPYGEMVYESLNMMIERTKMNPNDVSTIVRIGGTSEIPYFIKILKDRFPKAKIIQGDIFGGVSKGLARIGYDNNKDYLLE
ncbi:MAG: Hsp70 family protein [Candidatus Woesearchaeota archaeon]